MKNVAFVFLQALVSGALSWDLSSFGIHENYFASSMATYRNRAFLAIPRSSCYNNVTNPTLVEVPWYGESENAAFKRKHQLASIKDQKLGNCKQLQDVVSVDVERKKGRLWVLDRGNAKCHPKITVYSLHYNALIQSCVLKGIPRSDLNVLVVDSSSVEFGTRAYIGDASAGDVIVYSLNEGKWWRLRPVDPTGRRGTISSRYLAISRTKPELYLTDDDDFEMFVMDLSRIRSSEGPLAVISQDVVQPINVTFAGEKLGPSGGISTDFKQGLLYYLVRDFAILRWDTRKPLKAEYHEVLAQSYPALPYVSNLFLGPQNAIWALVNPSRPSQCDPKGVRNETYRIPEVRLKTRAVKILKYTKYE